MANTPLSKDVPHIYVPSFSVPHLKVPKLYVPHISTPGKGSFTPAERRHVKDLGDIILGNPITGTRQLRETLEDNNAANLIGNPVMSRLAGLGYLTKERLLEPYKEKSFTAATGTAFINSLESLGYSLDTLANPIKSLMPWAGGGKSGDFLRSMGWIDDEYREQYQWDTGIFAVDLAGEILSDPLNITKVGSKIALNTSGLYDELSMTIRNAVRNRWGDVIADTLPDSFVKQVVDELEKDVAKVDESKIINKLKVWAEGEQDAKLLTAMSAKNTADAMRYEAEFVAPYRKVLDLKQQDEFLSDLLDIKLSNAYRQYNAIRSVGETAKMIDNQLLKISLGINPLLGGNALLYKNLSPVVKAKWSNLVMTKKQFDLATHFDNSPATVKRIQRAATMKSKAKYKNVYRKFQGMLNDKTFDIDELVAQYYKILDNTPLSLRTKRGVDYEFVKWLRNKYPELRYVIDLINDPALKELIDSIKIGSTDPVAEIERLFPDLIEYVESTGPEAIVQAKQLNDVVNATADIAIQHKVISDTAKQKTKEYLTEQINNFFKPPKDKTIDDYPIIKRLEFIDQKILVDYKTGAHYGLKNLDAYRRFLKSTNPDAYQMLNEAFKMLGLDLDTITQDHPLITSYGKYIDSGKKKTHLIAEMKKYFDVNVADDRSSSNINTLKKVNLVQETNTHKRMEAFAKSKVADIDNELEKVAFDIKTNVIPTILYEEQGMNYDDAVQMFAMLDELFPYYGGSALYSGFDTTWEGSFKRLMEMSTDSIAKDPKTFYENFTNFKRNIDRMYWSLHNGTNDAALIEKIKKAQATRTVYIPHYKMVNGALELDEDLTEFIPITPLHENFVSIITELHDKLVIAQDTFMPRLIELASTGESIYKLQLTHKANISRLKLALEELFSTNPEVWNAYTDPTSPVRQNLERICNAYANKSDEALQFAKEIETVLTYLDATIAMNNLFDTIPSLTKYEMPALLNNILIDRILDVIEHYNTLKIDINTLDPKAIAKEILDEVYKVLNSKPVNKAKGRLYEQIIEEFFKLNPQYTDEFYWRIARLEPGTQISMDDYAKAYDSFKLDLGTQLEANLPKAIDQYLNSMKSLQQRNSFVTIGTIIDAQAIDNMNALGVFQADVIDALEGLNFNDSDVELVKDFISNVTGRYLRSEIEEARTSALQRLDDLKSVLTADEYRTELIVATKEALEGMRMVENTLGRTVTNTWNEIARYNDELQTVMGAGGKVKSKYGVNRMKNILSYIARSEIDNILGQEQTAYNIMSWAVANGEIGLKKVIDSNFLKRHFLNPSYFRLEAGVDDRLFAQLYENYNYYFNEVLSNKFYVLPDTTLETIKENLIKFTSENNTVNKWLPSNPELYFNKLDAIELVTWDQLIRTGMMEDRTALGYTLANKYKAIENMDEELDTITKNLGLKQALKKGIDIPEEVWQEAVDTIGEMHLSGLEDAFLTDINKYMKDIDSMQYHKHDFESFINRQQSAFNNLKPISALSEDTRELGDVIDFNKLSKFEQQQLASANINKHTRVNSKEFQKYLADETAHNIAMSIRTASAKELRGYIDNYTEGLMFFVSDGRPFKWSKAQLEEAGLVIGRVPESNIWIIRRTDNINRGYKFKWKMNKSLFPELREQYTDVIRKNRNYFNLQGMDVPDELITGDMLDTHTYRALLKDTTVQSLIGDETKQKLYSKLSKNGRNNFYYGDYSRINLALIGDNSNAYNSILDHFMTSLIDQGITPYFKSNRLDNIMYWGNTTAIKNVNKKTKFLQLFFNDDFSLGAPMFRRGLENATDAELKTFFDRNNFVACILKEDRHGNPRVYKIYIENRKQLADAIKAKAIVVPYETYSTLVSTVNTSLLEDKVFQAYTKYVVGAFKTIYLTVIGFLFRNGLDSLIYKNMNSTDGIPSMVDTFRYEVEARKMLKEYNDILKEALVRGGNEFHTKALEEILSELPKNKQIEFRLTNRFINSKASSGLAETMEEYYRSKELREGIVSNNKSFWASFNEDVIHGKYSPITIVNNANSNIEQTARYGLFLNLVHNGVDIQDALKKVIDTHFNYDLKGTNLELLEQVFWFSTFPINNFNYYINEGLTKNPELLKAQIAAMELSYNNGDITWDDVRNSNYLRYNATVGNIVIKVNGKNIVVKTGSSVFDFFNLLFNPAGEIGERVNPFLAVMLGLENVSELNPLSATYNRAKQFFQGRSLIPSLYSTLYERQQKVRFPKLAKAPTYYRKSRWNIKPRKSYFKNPDNMKRMRYRFTTYRYYFGRGKNYRRWLQSSTSIEPYWHNQNYKRLRSSRARSYKQQIKRM